MRQSVNTIYRILEEWLAGLKIPASQLVNHIPAGNLPPSGDTGSGYTPNPDAVTRTNVRKNSTGSVFSRRRFNFIEGTNVTLTVADDAGNEEVDITIDSPIGGGTVTSVGLALPAIFSVTGSPVTLSGTLTGAFVTQAANLVFAGPASGAAAAPTFRSLVALDIPALDASVITTGLLSPARGGTGIDNGALTLTFPASGTAALRASSATAGRVGFWSDANSLSHDAALFWDNTSKLLGVGAASAGDRLLVSTSSGDTSLKIESLSTSANAAYQKFVRSTTGASRQWWQGVGINDAGFDIYDQTAAATRVHITTAGDVGIGTIAPAANINAAVTRALTVSATGTAESAGLFMEGNRTSDAAVGQIGFINTAATGTDKRTALIIGNRDTDDNSGNLRLFTRNAGTLAEAMRINRLGNVGIGTATPATKFQAKGVVGNGGYFDADAVAGTEVEVWPDGGAVYEAYIPYGVVRNSAGAISIPNAVLPVPGAASTDVILANDGTNTLKARIYSTGRLTILRTAGTATFKIAMAYIAL
jgi:hypothetical protein